MRKVVRKFAKEREKTAAWRRILEQTTAGLLRQSEEASDARLVTSRYTPSLGGG